MQINPDTPSDSVHTPSMRAGPEEARQYLRQFLQENMVPLLEIIRTYVVRVGLARGEAVQAAATDILNDAVIEALAHADRFDATIQPRAWILAIAANVLKRKKAEAAKRQQRESLLSDLPNRSDGINEGDFFDQITVLTHPGPEQAIEARERVNEMLSTVSLNDQQVLRLALLHDLSASALAQVLSITPGAARVRLHRALNRLRTAWSIRESNRERGEHNA